MSIRNVFGGAAGTANGYTPRYISSVVSSGGDGTTSSVVGSDPHRAWTFATAKASLSAGQVGFCMDDGTYLFTSSQSLTNTGSSVSGYVVFAGIDNQNGANANGGRPLFDWQNNNVTGISAATGWWFENLELKRGNSGISGAANCVVWNVLSHDNLGHGLAAGNGTFVFCDSRNNTLSGFTVSNIGVRCLWCRAFNNTQNGFTTNTGSAFIFCEAYGNTLRGFDASTASSIPLLLLCTSDSNLTHGAEFGGTPGFLTLGSIFSNHSVAGSFGIKSALGKSLVDVLNHFYNNNTDVTSGAVRVGQSAGDPLYANLGGQDFALGNLSPAKAAALLSQFGTDSWLDKGAVQRREVAISRARVIGGF